MFGRLTQKKPHWPQLVELVSRSAHTPLQHTSLAMGHWYEQNPQLRTHPNETRLREQWARTEGKLISYIAPGAGRLPEHRWGTLGKCHTLAKTQTLPHDLCPEGIRKRAANTAERPGGHQAGRTCWCRCRCWSRSRWWCPAARRWQSRSRRSTCCSTGRCRSGCRALRASLSLSVHQLVDALTDGVHVFCFSFAQIKLIKIAHRRGCMDCIEESKQNIKNTWLWHKRVLCKHHVSQTTPTETPLRQQSTQQATTDEACAYGTCGADLLRQGAACGYEAPCYRPQAEGRVDACQRLAGLG